jgi:hypothetical protein
VNPNDPKEQSSTSPQGSPARVTTITQRFLDEMKANMEANRPKTMPKHLR